MTSVTTIAEIVSFFVWSGTYSAMKRASFLQKLRRNDHAYIPGIYFSGWSGHGRHLRETGAAPNHRNAVYRHSSGAECFQSAGFIDSADFPAASSDGAYYYPSEGGAFPESVGSAAGRTPGGDDVFRAGQLRDFGLPPFRPIYSGNFTGGGGSSGLCAGSRFTGSGHSADGSADGGKIRYG